MVPPVQCATSCEVIVVSSQVFRKSDQAFPGNSIRSSCQKKIEQMTGWWFEPL